MGLFSAFKKALSGQNSFMCDFVSGPKEYKSATVSFTGNGTFKINSDVYPANFPYVKDIGMSRDMKYERIVAGDWLFYARKNEGTQLFQCLNSERSTSIFQSTSIVHQKDFKQDYLALGMNILEVPLVFNVQGISHNYQADTRKLIAQMHLGSTLNLKYWPDAPDDEHKICVFDDHSRQIGYQPIGGDPFEIEMKKQIEFGIPFSATVVEKGIVQDTDIWWCKAEFTLRAPYPQDSEMVFVGGFGGAYHCRCGCCRADWEVPMFWVSQYNMTPCKRCHKVPKGSLASDYRP